MKKALILLASLALMAGTALAQDKSNARYAPGREKLAEETFKQLVAISLKTAENLLVNKLDGKSYYTARSNEKWNELGEAYTAKRREIRREYAEE